MKKALSIILLCLSLNSSAGSCDSLLRLIDDSLALSNRAKVKKTLLSQEITESRAVKNARALSLAFAEIQKRTDIITRPFTNIPRSFKVYEKGDDVEIIFSGSSPIIGNIDMFYHLYNSSDEVLKDVTVVVKSYYVIRNNKLTHYIYRTSMDHTVDNFIEVDSIDMSVFIDDFESGIDFLNQAPKDVYESVKSMKETQMPKWLDSYGEVKGGDWRFDEGWNLQRPKVRLNRDSKKMGGPGPTLF